MPAPGQQLFRPGACSAGVNWGELSINQIYGSSSQMGEFCLTLGLGVGWVKEKELKAEETASNVNP